MEWQPIETAPKDGTPVLLYATPRMEVGYWNVAVTDVGITGWYPSMYWRRPTHWMPLPEPPEDA